MPNQPTWDPDILRSVLDYYLRETQALIDACGAIVGHDTPMVEHWPAHSKHGTEDDPRTLSVAGLGVIATFWLEFSAAGVVFRCRGFGKCSGLRVAQRLDLN
ncbi:MAG: hypothetical protein ABW217_03805 [Polyangiaceae bacterium]